MTFHLEMSPDAFGGFCLMTGLVVGFMLGMIAKFIKEE